MSRRVKNLDSLWLAMPALSLVAVGVLVPIGVLAAYSLWPTVDQEVVHRWTLENYRRFFEGREYWQTLLKTFAFVGVASATTVVVTFPFAYFVALRVRPARRVVWVVMAVLPFFTSYLIRVLVWMNLLGDEGVLNDALRRSGLIRQPLSLLGNNKWGIVITFVYLLFPLAFLTTYVVIERMNPALLDAGADLGATPRQRLTRITLPIARTGLLAGFIFCFIAMLGDYVTPLLIGGTEGYMYSNLITNQFGSSVQWGFGSALALILMAAIFVLLLSIRRVTGAANEVGAYTRAFTPTRSPGLLAYSVFFLGYLYAPIALLVLLAFNDRSTIGLPITGLTLDWFRQAAEDPLLLESLRNSLEIATTAVGVSTLLGTPAAVYLARRRGRARDATLLTLALPMFLPPMLLGLAIIIGLDALGLSRGMWTIALGHIILTIPIVTMLVLVRLEGLDQNLELAAMDLGASPRVALVRISAPQAIPGIIAAGLISFALSMDEFILTSLVTGSDSTLPLYIFGQLRFSITPAVVAVSALLLLASGLLLVAGALIASIGRRGSNRSAADFTGAIS